MNIKLNGMRLVFIALGLLLVQMSQATVFFLFNATNEPIQAWANCNLIHDSKNKPYTIYPQFRLSIPFVQAPFCNIGKKGAEHGFFWRDGQGRFWKGNEVTGAAVLGFDLYIIQGNGAYTRITLPSGMPIADLGRFLGEKMVDIANAVEKGQPLDVLFKTLGFPGVTVSVRQGESENPNNLY